MGRHWFRMKKAGSEAAAEPQPWRRFRIFAWRLKRLRFPVSILDNLLYRILSVVEAVVLVSGLCFYFCCCGCHI